MVMTTLDKKPCETQSATLNKEVRFKDSCIRIFKLQHYLVAKSSSAAAVLSEHTGVYS